MSIISIANLTYAYKKGNPVLDGLNLKVSVGSIYGFLGKNGAGKSTTMRAVLGLLKPKAGTIEVFGKNMQKARPAVFKRIGSLIEKPSLYPYLNAVDHLRIGAKYTGADPRQIEKVLEKVNLLQHHQKIARNYSTGMKQRLGLAMALLHDPDLLILDEPTNGLDPTGIMEIRNILLKLRAAGKTIMLSSHQLSEVERMATHVGILNNGKLLFEGTTSELENYKRVNTQVKLRMAYSANTNHLLQNYNYKYQDDGYYYVQLPYLDRLPVLIRLLAERGVDIYEVSPAKSDLEKLFLDITND